MFKNKNIVLFDGVCNMCVFSVKFIIKRDKKDLFRFASIQSNVGQKIIEENEIDVKKMDSIILIYNNKIKYRSSAVLTVLWYLNTIWTFLIIFYPVPIFLRDFLYKFIARRRYFLFGKRNKCLIPNEKYASKFLDLNKL